MKSIIVIPSRIGSTRLKRKPLIKLNGKTLIERVYEGCKTSKLANRIVVATDSKEIKKEVLSFGGEVILTPKNINTGTDRVGYIIKNKIKESYDIVLNIQGDEPMVNGKMVDLMIKSLSKEKDKSVVISTLKTKFKNLKDVLNPNFVKVICDKFDNAIYFSRSVIPNDRENKKNFKHFRHMGYYCYRKDFLLKYIKMKQTPLERMELLEQLRAIENGYKIKVIETKFDTIEINDKSDVKRFEKKFRK